MSSIKNLRYIALAEATTFLMLLVATYFKVAANTSGGQTAVSALGPIHGILFLAYVVLTINVRSRQQWGPRTTILILAGAVIPSAATTSTHGCAGTAVWRRASSA